MRPQPTFFELRCNDTQITYSTTSLAGVPQLSYQDKSLNLNFSGDEIRSLDTEIGRQVSVTLEQIPDQQTVSLTLLVPTINLPEGTTETSIQTEAILTTGRTSIGGPDLVDGQLQTYSSLMLPGVARLIQF